MSFVRLAARRVRVPKNLAACEAPLRRSFTASASQMTKVGP